MLIMPKQFPEKIAFFEFLEKKNKKKQSTSWLVSVPRHSCAYVFFF